MGLMKAHLIDRLPSISSFDLSMLALILYHALIKALTPAFDVRRFLFCKQRAVDALADDLPCWWGFPVRC